MIVTSDTDLAAAAVGCGYEVADMELKGRRVFWHIKTEDDLQTKFYVGKGDMALAKRVLDAKKYLVARAKGKLTN
mgnify:CR=1 FL=1